MAPASSHVSSRSSACTLPDSIRNQRTGGAKPRGPWESQPTSLPLSEVLWQS